MSEERKEQEKTAKNEKIRRFFEENEVPENLLDKIAEKIEKGDPLSAPEKIVLEMKKSEIDERIKKEEPDSKLDQASKIIDRNKKRRKVQEESSPGKKNVGEMRKEIEELKKKWEAKKESNEKAEKEPAEKKGKEERKKTEDLIFEKNEWQKPIYRITEEDSASGLVERFLEENIPKHFSKLDAGQQVCLMDNIITVIEANPESFDIEFINDTGGAEEIGTAPSMENPINRQIDFTGISPIEVLRLTNKIKTMEKQDLFASIEKNEKIRSFLKKHPKLRLKPKVVEEIHDSHKKLSEKKISKLLILEELRLDDQKPEEYFQEIKSWMEKVTENGVPKEERNKILENESWVSQIARLSGISRKEVKNIVKEANDIEDEDPMEDEKRISMEDEEKFERVRESFFEEFQTYFGLKDLETEWTVNHILVLFEIEATDKEGITPGKFYKFLEREVFSRKNKLIENKEEKIDEINRLLRKIIRESDKDREEKDELLIKKMRNDINFIIKKSIIELA